MSSTHDVRITRTSPKNSDAPRLRRVSIRLDNGVQLDCVEQGPATGPALLLLHGLASSWRAFEGLLELLPPSARCVAVTLRGHAASDRPTDGYRLKDFAEDARLLLDALEIPSALLAGHALGASVAMRFALDHDERTLGLVLIGAYARHRTNAALCELQDIVTQLSDPVDGGFIRDFVAATHGDRVTPEALERALQAARAVPAQVWRAVTEQLAGAAGELGTHEIRVPTLLVWGNRDRFAPRGDQERLLHSIPGARLIEAPCGHAVHSEAPQLLARTLAVFAAECHERQSISRDRGDVGRPHRK